VRTKERGPGCANKRDRAMLKRARLYEQKRKGNVMGTQKRGPNCLNKRERAPLWE